MKKTRLASTLLLLAVPVMLLQCAALPPLSKASYDGNIRLAQERIAGGDDVNAYDDRGMTPLMWASYSSNYEIIEMLLEKGANINLQSKQSYVSMARGSTALMMAAYQGNQMVVKLLMKHNPDRTLKDVNECTVKTYSRKGGNQTIIEMMKQ